MAQWGSVDFRALRELSNRMERLSSVDFDAFCREAARELAARLLRKAKKRTPAVYGSLRNAWAVLPVQYNGTVYSVEVLNNLEYASYVEYGHRQTPGRFIPGHWECDRFIYDPADEGGMVLKRAWVPGAFMLKISEDEVRQLSPALLERKLEKLLREVF